MKKSLAAAAIVAALSLTGWMSVTPASAAPPTATVSPGYDARLAASRSTDVSSRRYYRRYYRPYAYGYRPYRPYYRPYYNPYRYYGPGLRFGFY